MINVRINGLTCNCINLLMGFLVPSNEGKVSNHNPYNKKYFSLELPTMKRQETKRQTRGRRTTPVKFKDCIIDRKVLLKKGYTNTLKDECDTSSSDEIVCNPKSKK